MAVVGYKCPNCGAGLLFDPETQKLGCEYCAARFTQAELERLAAQQAARAAQNADDFQQHALVYSCPTCGAEVVCTDTTAATFCYYCHNPVVLSGRLAGALQPDKVIPFTITKPQAEQAFLQWIQKKWFVPQNFFSKSQVEKISGVYYPYWLVDCEMEGNMEAVATDVRTWRQGDTEYTEKERYEIQRAGRAQFPDMSRLALNGVDRRLVESVQPFDTTRLQEFQMPFLSGFLAEKRNMEADGFRQDVCDEAAKYIADLLRGTVQGHSTVNAESWSARMTNSKWTYALLPVWALTYRQGKETYYYAMNGQTGRVCGVLPISWKRLFSFAGVLAAFIFGLCALGGYLIWVS